MFTALVMSIDPSGGCGVTGAGVVPRAAALGARGVQPFDHGDRPVRLQPPQQRTQGGAHDARAHQHDVDARDSYV
jgi:hypothetical protein